MLKKVFLSALLTSIITFLTGCDTLNSLRMMQINSDVIPVVNTEQPVTLKARFIGEKPYVFAKVNGEELLFLIDTGARFLMLFDTPKVKKLELPEGFQLALSGWGEEKDTRAYQTDIEELDMAGVQFSGLKAAYIPISTSPYFLREDEVSFDGVIGHDMLKHFVWRFDKSNNVINVSQKIYQPSERAEAFNLDIFFSKIKIEGELAFNNTDSAKGDFIIDTGSRHYLKISSQFTQNRNIVIDSAKVIAADFGLNGKVEHERVTLPKLTLGSLKIPNIKTNLIPSKDDDEDDFWVIGNALLNQFNTVIDYPNEVMYLEPQQPFNVRYNVLGIELRKIRSGEFVIRYLFPDFPASKLDLREGDLVTELSGISAKDLSLDDVLEISASAGNKRICIKRENQCFNIPAQHIAGYSVSD